MAIVPAYWSYVDRNNDGKWETLRVKRGGKWSKKLTIFEVRKQQKLAKAGGYGFRSKRIPAFNPKPKPPKDTLLSLAHSQLGETEYPPGSNCQKFGKWYGMNCVAWCAIGISWLCWKLGIDFHYAYVPYAVSDARNKRNGLFILVNPEVGCLVAFDFDGGDADHIGIVKKIYADGSFDTYEFNTGTGDDADGGQVQQRRRYRSQVEAFFTSDEIRAAR